MPNLTAVPQPLISLPLFFFLPGHATLAAFRASRPGALRTESQESRGDLPRLCFPSLLLSVLLSSWIALLLGEMGWLTPRNLVFLFLGYLSVVVLYLLRALLSIIERCWTKSAFSMGITSSIWRT